MAGENNSNAPCGWNSNFREFYAAESTYIVNKLEGFVDDPGEKQIKAWKASVPWLQRECEHVVKEEAAAYSHTTILEYELPRDLRRPDVIILGRCAIAVLELKGAPSATQAALDQVLGYVRDLRAYHRACESIAIYPVLVVSNGPLKAESIDDVRVVGPKGVHALLIELEIEHSQAEPVSSLEFLDEDAYAPLPNIVQAARDLFHHRPLPFIKRARAATEPAIEQVSKIAHHAAESKTRHLVLVKGVPGAGKTLVGLQAVHAGWLDDLAIPRQGGKKQIPAVYLSGNGPLVAVLQDALKREGANGSAFVQDIKKYVRYYQKKPKAIPPEHLLVFDEAQRAHDADRVAHVHKTKADKSEPELLIEFVERIPDWSVLVGLVGTGQAIHVGEEGGLKLWRDAILRSNTPDQWTVHGSPDLQDLFEEARITFQVSDALNLDTEIRFHLTPKVHDYVDRLLSNGDEDPLNDLGDELYRDGHRFLVTRNLEAAKSYLHQRYEGAPLARFGMLASSKDKMLPDYGVDNSFQTTKRLKVGEWYNEEPSHANSCCQLEQVATEFSAQGLELDCVLLAWGSDLLFEDGEWSMRLSRGTRGTVHDPLQLRLNVYRVLLTRGRDGSVVFVPPDDVFDSTFERLVSAGFKILG